jgi:hypothetical protein
VICLTCLVSSIFTLLPLDLLGCACLWVQGSLPCSWSSTQEHWFVLEVKRNFELCFAGALRGGGLTTPSVLGAPGAV